MKLCPLLSLDSSATFDRPCMEDKCAWWVSSECAMIAITACLGVCAKMAEDQALTARHAARMASEMRNL